MGEYAEALRCTREALAIAEDIAHEQWTCAALTVLGAIHLDLLQLDDARVHLERAHALAKEMRTDIWVQQSADFLVSTYLLLRRVDLARGMLDAAPIAAGSDSIAHRWHDVAIAAVAMAEGDHEEALRRIDDLIGRAQQVDDDRTPVRLAFLRAQVLVRLNRGAEAGELLRGAIPVAEAHGHRSLLWRMHAVLATALLEAGDRDAARNEADATLEVIEALVGDIDDALAAESFRQQAQTLLPATLRRRNRGGVDVLTEREAEIAALIARGLSNRAIADELVLSARTVETHVANAMSKLGFSSRTQLATWATEHNR
jgi:DNA-binding CsgD family transcriptional regulator